MSETSLHQVVCFGEVLFDIFPSGAEPGGAPMNVAYHLHKQQKNPALITRIGVDEEGRKLINFFSGRGLGTDHFQVDCEHETGKVYARLNAYNEASYDILMPVAWDFIQWEDGLQRVVESAGFFVFGSLAARSGVSRETLFRCLEMARCKVLDINLRAPHFSKRNVEELMSRADLLKLNVAELELITGWFSNYRSIEDRVRFIADKFSFSGVAVTMGGDGAMLFMNGVFARHKGIEVDVVDTVGCGDAFLAGLLSRLTEDAPPEEALAYACRLGAFIATQRGACPEYELKNL
ncbi:MAG: carbohydrate kinase [Chitinophagaceae bacterium]|nr:carbohydrate kinase [Chitinophagaceae bacterium]